MSAVTRTEECPSLCETGPACNLEEAPRTSLLCYAGRYMDVNALASVQAEIQKLRAFIEVGLKHIRQQVTTNALAHYAQVEALLSLHSVIRFKHPLPPMRGWGISPDFALILVSVIREHKPRIIVEL